MAGPSAEPGIQPDPGPDPGLVAALRAAGCVFAEDEARLLEAEVEAAGPESLEAMLARRVAGEPLEQVLGWAEFRGLRVRLVPGVFVPRRRTEALVALGVAALRGSAGVGRRPVVVDLCCGSGAIGLAIDHECGGVDLHAADLDPAAVACARLNLPADRVHEGDLYAALPSHLRGRVDLLAVNAPYVPTEEIQRMPPEARDHEHRVALDGGGDGLQLHRRVTAGSTDWLAPGARLLIETSRGQSGRTADLCREAGLTASVRRDASTQSTVVVAISADPGASGIIEG